MNALIIIGCVSLAIAAVFFWLNNNTPVQTCIPAILLPVGAICLLIALGGYFS